MKKADLIVIAILIIISVALLFLFSRGEDGATAVVTVDGNEVGRYSLYDNGEYSLNGGTNILIIENGEAYLIEANCPDKLCVNMGRIKKTGQSITCLPNHLNIRIEGAGEAEYDILVG